MPYRIASLRFSTLFYTVLLASVGFAVASSAHAAVPVIAAHENIVLEATSAGNSTGFAPPAVVYTAPTATDETDGEVPATCIPASGSFFSFGTTDVACDYHSASNGDAVTTHFSVVIQDTTLPLIGSHADTPKTATGLLTIVNYGTPNAFDPAGFRLEGTRPADCVPTSGSFFPIGTTIITCNAVDSSGNHAIPVIFNVVVSLPLIFEPPVCETGFHAVGPFCAPDEVIPVVDVCANIEGVQAEALEGTEISGEDCITIEVSTPPSGSSGGGGGGGRGRSGGSASHDGEVLGASTDTSSSGGSCHLFSSDLTLGATGADVTALQNVLIGKGYAIPSGATGYFGVETKSALALYQSADGITPASGYFGPLTRLSLNASCTLSYPQQPTLSELLALLTSLQSQLAAMQ